MIGKYSVISQVKNNNNKLNKYSITKVCTQREKPKRRDGKFVNILSFYKEEIKCTSY